MVAEIEAGLRSLAIRKVGELSDQFLQDNGQERTCRDDFGGSEDPKVSIRSVGCGESEDQVLSYVFELSGRRTTESVRAASRQGRTADSIPYIERRTRHFRPKVGCGRELEFEFRDLSLYRLVEGIQRVCHVVVLQWWFSKLSSL